MQSNIPAVRDLVLIGGGHSHVEVLKHFSMNPVPGVRLTLVSDADVSPYSGMVPGYIAGHYALDEIQIALEPLCRRAGARFIGAEVTGVDTTNKRVLLQNRPALQYDLLSINSGAQPDLKGQPGLAVKPIAAFLNHWPKLKTAIEQQDTPVSVVIVGAGAGGVEVAMACRASLPSQTTITLIGPRLLSGLSRQAARLCQRAFKTRRVEYLSERVIRAVEDPEGFTLALGNGATKLANHLLWVTDVRAPSWVADTGLACDKKGFLSVGSDLRSVSDNSVFAVGDIAHLRGQERAKAGVYAVRAAPVLARNLAKAVQGLPLSAANSRFKAQRSFLTLIGLGSVDAPDAIATKGIFALQGRRFWQLKNWIDRRFMERYNRLPEMPVVTPQMPNELAVDMPDESMRCGGCGSKLAADPLRRVLARLPNQDAAHVVLGIGDDAAQVVHGTGTTLMSVDGFRAMIDDPYVLGRICAHHSLNDLFAMGAQPSAALALATIPLMSERLMEEDLFQLLSGVVAVLNAHGAPLVGGHSAEGVELSIALTVTGVPGESTLTKAGAKDGDALVLTKPIGTGVILAAAMRGLHIGGAVEACMRSMDFSNAAALQVLQSHKVRALTDITGFGLIGHLAEMLRASNCGAKLNLRNIPMLAGAMDLAKQGVRSSLQRANAQALQDFSIAESAADERRLALLSDPQTSGGLLASVPADQLDKCLEALGRANVHASVVGYMTSANIRVIE